VIDSLERSAQRGRWLANLWFEEGVRVEATTDAGGRDGNNSGNNSGRNSTINPATNPGSLKESERWQEVSVSLQYESSPGRVGFACAPVGMTSLDTAGGFDAAALFARARASARVIEPDPARSLPEALPEVLGYPPLTGLRLDDDGWDSLLPEKGLELAQRLGEAVRDFSGEIESVRKPTFEAVRERRLVALSSGGAGSVERLGWTSSDYSLQVEAASRRAGDREGSWATGQSRFLAELDPVAVGLDAGRRTVELLGAGPVATGRFDVVLDWRVTTQILELLAPALIGESHLKQTTFLLGRVGERVFSERITITDDGTLPGGPDTQPLDEEGTARGRTVCVQSGRLERLLYDRASAYRAGARSTGNGAGSPGGSASPSETNLVMAAGVSSPEALVGALKKGLWVREVMGLHTADLVSGDFSVGVSGLWVENGEVVGPISGGTISGNLGELFERVAEVGSDLRFLGTVAAPSVLIEGVELAGEG
jgi:PmbA protein